MPDTKSKKFKVIVFGAEKKGITTPDTPIDQSDYEVHFGTFEGSQPFDKYDIAVIFQGLFERQESTRDLYGKTDVKVKCNRQDLDKRNNEVQLLLQKGGAVCFLLCQDFYEPYNKFNNTDCVKYWLNAIGIDRKDFQRTHSPISIVRDEFRSFLGRYGRCHSYLAPSYDCEVESDITCLAKFNDYSVGIAIFDNLFFVPICLPVATEVESYFGELTEAIISTRRKLIYSIPGWARQFEFEPEKKLLVQKKELEDKLANFEKEIRKYDRYKRILVYDGELLKKAVSEVLEKGLGFSIDDTENYREDIKIVDSDKNPLVFIEVTGTNKSLSGKKTNQCLTHREEAGLKDDFPALLIINTHMKNNNLEEKDRALPKDQVRHAKRNNVLVLRTLDLLRMLNHYFNKKITQEDILGLFQKETGWLCVSGETWAIISGDEPTEQE